MTKKEFAKAVKMVENEDDFENVDTAVFYGCALPEVKKVYCTIRQVAACLVWHCRTYGGEWDSLELDNMADIARRKFVIIG